MTSLGSLAVFAVCVCVELFGIHAKSVGVSLFVGLLMWVTCFFFILPILFKSLQWFTDFLKDRGTFHIFSLPLGRRLGDQKIIIRPQLTDLQKR